jgi:hypothetical protein
LKVYHWFVTKMCSGCVFFLKAGGSFVNDPRKTNATYGGAYFFILDSRTPRWRAPLPADTGGSLVNDPRKTNATYGGACFSFGSLH